MSRSSHQSRPVHISGQHSSRKAWVKTHHIKSRQWGAGHSTQLQNGSRIRPEALPQSKKINKSHKPKSTKFSWGQPFCINEQIIIDSRKGDMRVRRKSHCELPEVPKKIVSDFSTVACHAGKQAHDSSLYMYYWHVQGCNNIQNSQFSVFLYL